MTPTHPRYYASIAQQPMLSTRRILVVALIIGAILTTVAFRGLTLQVLDASVAEERGRNQSMFTQDIVMPRGLITDRNGTVLAVSNLAYTARINPFYEKNDPQKRYVTDTLTLSAAVARGIGQPQETVKANMDRILTSWTKETSATVSTIIAADISIQQLNVLTTQLVTVKRCCISIEEGWKRTYPQGTLAAGVLGYVNREPSGLSGVEDFYNNILRATPGQIVQRGPELLTIEQSSPGSDVTLTLDANLQRFIEQRLAKALKDYDANGGSIIVMDTRTGAILGMASLPNYDPNTALNQVTNAASARKLRNPAISDVYDPGSTMKVVTWAAAIDSGKVTTRTVFNDTGVYRTDGIPIYNSSNGRYGNVTLLEVFQHSINTVTAQVARELMGPTLFYEYARRFGYGNATGIDLGGEEKGILNSPESPRWSPIVLTTNSYGQGVSMTPIQVICAINAVANDGAYVQPHVVDHYTLPNGDVKDISTIRRYQSVSPQAARETRAALAEATRTATPEVLFKGYSVAGKTGTAEQRPNGIPMARPIHTYAGFFPASNPRITILVKLDYPRPAYAKDTALPVFKDVAERTAQIFNIPPDLVK
ncbi:MAG: penicillin-binding protein 2 [Thermoflexales bacterium]|nr:penicillin-binding protein 2 [Thermoflexales bacterium]